LTTWCWATGGAVCEHAPFLVLAPRPTMESWYVPWPLVPLYLGAGPMGHHAMHHQIWAVATLRGAGGAG